jgi:transposase
VREVWRTRAPLVRPHTAQVLRVPNRLARKTGARFRATRMHECPKAARAGGLPEANQGLAVTSSLALLDWLRHQIKTLAKAVTTALTPTPASEQRWTGDGIGTIWAQTIGLDTGARGRLPTGGHAAASGRWVKRTKSSHGKRTGQGHVNNGHPSLAWASREAAQCASRFNPPGPRVSPRQPATSPRMVARKAVAHTLARACSYRLRDLVAFEVHQAFG